MCDGCPLQTLADFHHDCTTELRIWHGRTGEPDVVMLSVTRQGEQLAVRAGSCREAVKKLLEEMDEKRIGDCAVVMTE